MAETNPFNPQPFYAQQGQISDPGVYANHLNNLPSRLPELIQIIQGLMLHIHWANRYGVTLTKVRQEEANLRTISDRLAKILGLHDAPLNQARSLSKKTIGTCRDYALLLTAILRHKGIPARARTGFGTYFSPGQFEDHWVCEYWHAANRRWMMVDPQLDVLQCEVLSIDFDPLNMPREKFVTGGQAWARCRSETADPELFGIFDMRGMDFIKANLILDFLSLNKIEFLPWDNFKLITKNFDELTQSEKELLDQLMHVSSGEDRDFVLLRSTLNTHQQQLLPDNFH